MSKRAALRLAQRWLAASQKVVIHTEAYAKSLKPQFVSMMGKTKEDEERFLNRLVSSGFYTQEQADKELAQWTPYTRSEATRDFNSTLAEAVAGVKEQAALIQAAIARAGRWFGSQVHLKAAPLDPRSESYSPTIFVYVARGSNWKSAPGFLIVDEHTVDDVLEAGSSEDFQGPENESDYHTLIAEIRKPGSTSKAGKRIKLYTARPRKDRAIYDNAAYIPSGIFLSTSLSKVEGFGADHSTGGLGRDLYRVTVADNFLIETLNRGGLRDFQSYDPSGRVPITDIELIGSLD